MWSLSSPTSNARGSVPEMWCGSPTACPVSWVGDDPDIPSDHQVAEQARDGGQPPLDGRRPSPLGRLVVRDDGRPFDRRTVHRYVEAIAKRAGIGHVHPHQLRHTLATQAINRGMSLEAIAALLGHRSMRMTMTYARISDRTVADEYFRVTESVEANYGRSDRLPDEAAGANMRRLAVDHRRMLGNGMCTRPVELDCSFESSC